jgi:quinol monooxygenase YgiN
MSQTHPDDPGTALFLVVTIRPRLDQLAEAEAQLHRMRAASQQEEGCEFMHLVQGGIAFEGVPTENEPDTWTMLEKFTSRPAWDEHMASEHNQRGNAELEPLLRAPSTLRLFHEKVG